MAEQQRGDVRDIGIIAHVDHGKTTLVDALLWQSSIFREGAKSARHRVEALDPSREKRVDVMPKHVSVVHDGTRINLIDVPGHADFGAAIERTLRMADGVLFVVDAGEGPLPQTRFGLRKAFEAGLVPIVAASKMDLPGARPREVVEQVRALFADLEASERQLEFPVLYCDARRGLARLSPDGADEPLLPLFERVVRSIPVPARDAAAPLQLLVTALDYDDFLGRLAVGRVFDGSIAVGDEVAQCQVGGRVTRGRVSGLFGFDGTRRVEVTRAQPGDIVCVSGLEAVAVGETLSSPTAPRPLPALPADEPTVYVVVSANDSPLAGQDGRYVDARRLRERLFRVLLTNPSIHVEEAEAPDSFRVAASSELQLAMLIEMMRREGFELSVSRPRIVTRQHDGTSHEPIESLVIDCPEAFVGVVTEKLEARRAQLARMVNNGSGRVRIDLRVPTRGLIGFRTEFLRDTRGAGILHHVFDKHEPSRGEIPRRGTGALIADRPGRATAFAIEHLQQRGALFVAPDEQVYEGMIVGESAQPLDLDVNVAKERKPVAAEISPEAGRPTVRLIPPRLFSLEQALEFVRDDELVEVTPRALRLRKRVLQAARRTRKT